MANVVEFKKIKGGGYNKGGKKSPIMKRSCVPPIAIERIDYSSAIIRFHTTCFNLEMVKFALGRIKNGQNYWVLYRLGENNRFFDPLWMNYLVLITDPPQCGNDEAFRHIFSLMSEKAYIMELSAWPSKTSVDELAKVYTLDLSLGATISPKVVNMLKSNGINNAFDLIQMSREELCEIPGMTTQSVFKIEKSLAARGLFLTTKNVLLNKKQNVETALEG